MPDLSVLSQTGWQFMLDGDEQMQPGFVDFQNFAQGFANREAFFAREFQKTHQVGFRQGGDTGVGYRLEIFMAKHSNL